jgi:hypothetical protein
MGKAIFLSDASYVNRNLREALRAVLHRSTLDRAMPHAMAVPESIYTRKRRPRCEIDQSSSSSVDWIAQSV